MIWLYQFNLVELVSIHILTTLITSLLKVFLHFVQIGLDMSGEDSFIDWLQGMNAKFTSTPFIIHPAAHL